MSDAKPYSEEEIELRRAWLFPEQMSFRGRPEDEFRPERWLATVDALRAEITRREAEKIERGNVYNAMCEERDAAYEAGRAAGRMAALEQAARDCADGAESFEKREEPGTVGADLEWIRGAMHALLLQADRLHALSPVERSGEQGTR